MKMLQGVWKQHLWPRAVVGYGAKIFLSSPPNYVTRSPGINAGLAKTLEATYLTVYLEKPRRFSQHFGSWGIDG